MKAGRSLATRSRDCDPGRDFRAAPFNRSSSRYSERDAHERTGRVLRRELALVLRARVTWLQAALAALLVGHGFVLAVDLYTAGSRSAATGTLMAREF